MCLVVLVWLLLSFLTAMWAVGLKLLGDVPFISTPLPMLIGTFFTTGVICGLMGLMAELIMRTYYEAQGKDIYQVRERINSEKVLIFMCGIAGFSGQGNRGDLESMMRAILHRGPMARDASRRGIWPILGTCSTIHHGF